MDLDELMPPDPDVEKLATGLDGVATTAKLLGEFRRRLEDEGFDREESLELCEHWLNALAERLG